MSLANSGAAAITAVNNRRYAVGSVARLLCKLFELMCLIKLKFIYFVDIASGSTVDWAYDVLKIPFSFTIELPPTQSKPFVFCQQTKISIFLF